jgi:hypothetical protein
MRPGPDQSCRPAWCAALLLAAGLVTPAWAQPTQVWHCQVAGHITYADRPCKDVVRPVEGVVTATQREVQVADPRTASQERQAQEAARSQERLVRQLQQERQLRERQVGKPAGAVIIGLPPDPLARPAVRPTSKDIRKKQPGARSAARTSPATAAASRRAPD